MVARQEIRRGAPRGIAQGAARVEDDGGVRWRRARSRTDSRPAERARPDPRRAGGMLTRTGAVAGGSHGQARASHASVARATREPSSRRTRTASVRSARRFQRMTWRTMPRPKGTSMNPSPACSSRRRRSANAIGRRTGRNVERRRSEGRRRRGGSGGENGEEEGWVRWRRRSATTIGASLRLLDRCRRHECNPHPLHNGPQPLPSPSPQNPC